MTLRSDLSTLMRLLYSMKCSHLHQIFTIADEVGSQLSYSMNAYVGRSLQDNLRNAVLSVQN